MQFVEDSEEALKFATCAGCGGRIPILSTLSLEIEVLSPPDKVNVWLCDECQARRLRFPKTHPDYLIEEWIGEGGMGEVFRARQLSRGRPVAIKMISENNVIGSRASDYFRREIEVLRNLLMPSGECHHSIVAFYEIFEVDSQFHLVMEYVDGKNAFEWLAGLEKPLPIASGAADRPSLAVSARISAFKGIRASRR